MIRIDVSLPGEKAVLKIYNDGSKAGSGYGDYDITLESKKGTAKAKVKSHLRSKGWKLLLYRALEQLLENEK